MPTDIHAIPATESSATGSDMTRRTLLRCTALVGAAGLSGAALSACGSDDGGNAGAGATSPPETGTSSPTASASETPPSGGAPATVGSGAALAKAADVPVGSAVVARGPDGAPYVVVQATPTAFTGLSAVCTHMQCTVGVAGDRLDCPCHGSRYALTGAVLRGPATAPLPAVAVGVSGEDVVLL